MSFYSLLKGLSDKNVQVTVEMKNDLEITGYLKTVDYNLNVSLDNINVSESEKYPYLVFYNLKISFLLKVVS
jgi:U6 snRNA-associated Sm-like protein LSm2